MTIFRIYTENGCHAGFWVQHRTWRNMCGIVRSVAGQQRGTLPGAPPHYDNAPVNIETFDVRSGRPVAVPESLPSDDRHYSRIAQPHWYRPLATHSN
jgi:hypothetical protein